MLLHVPGKSYQKILENKSCNASSKSSLSKKKKTKKKQDYVCNLQTVQTGCESMNDKSLIS